LQIPTGNLQALTSLDADGWKKEAQDIAGYYAKFNGRLPQALKEQLAALSRRLG